MSSIQWDDVLSWAPGVDGVDELAQEDIVRYVNTDAINPVMFGGESTWKLRLARILLAAHLGEVWKRRGQGGAVTSETVAADSLSASYAAPWHGSISSLETTAYGLEFQRMVSTSLARLPRVLG